MASGKKSSSRSGADQVAQIYEFCKFREFNQPEDSVTHKGPLIGGEVNHQSNRVKSAPNRAIVVRTDHSRTGIRAVAKRSQTTAWTHRLLAIVAALVGASREDAARRDFTMNALYADPVTGRIFDYFGGCDDLEAHRVRFIGDPLQRIAEDHLRILRFFRFHARFGDDPDAASLEACTQRANDLMALSRERIAAELLKLLVAVHAVRVVRMMIDHGIFTPVLPARSLLPLKTTDSPPPPRSGPPSRARIDAAKPRSWRHPYTSRETT